jgi:short-subunit dehydrogenase
MAKKIAIVTGASSGIGKETAILLTKNGYKVYAFNRRETNIREVELVAVDITKPEDIKRGVATVLEREGRIDLLVNNAGMCISGAAEETSDESAYYIFNVNFFGAFRLAREVLPSMRANGGGRIINVSSIAAVFYPPFQGFYSASKAALSVLFSAMHLEVRPFGITITNVMPGDTKTGFTDNRRMNENPLVAYAKRIAASMAVVEKGERKGMPPAAVAKVIVKQATAKKPKAAVGVGLANKLLITFAKLLPAGLINIMLSSIYGGEN